jgi:ribosome recycling factor
MPADRIAKECKSKMDKAVEHMKHEFKSVRTGRATTTVVESVQVNYYGATTPLNQLASLSIVEGTIIVIKPFDVSCVSDIDKAIMAANLGLTPQNDGKILTIKVPPLSTERRIELVVAVKAISEQAKVSLRNARRDANKAFDQAEKKKEISEDDRDGYKKDGDDLTKKFTDIIEKIFSDKSQELQEV